MRELLTFLIIVTSMFLISTLEPECFCGQRKSSLLDLKIIGGKEAEVNEFPWAVLLLISDGDRSRRCGGTLINDRYVLTAAHCLHANQLNITAVLGDHDIYEKYETKHLKIDVKPYRYFKHWAYELDQNQGAQYDFALLELSKSVDFKKYSHIRPVCLPSSKEIEYNGVVGTVIGWGAEEVGFVQTQPNIIKGFPTSGSGGKLQKINKRILNQNSCRQIMKRIDKNFKINDSNMCGLSETGDSCEGDSGGGLFLPHPNEGFDEIVGVVSYGIGCNSTFNGSRIPGIYSRVSSIVDWIRNRASNAKFCRTPIQPNRTGTGWSSWGPWSSCNRTCGVGLRTRVKHCLKKGCGRRGHIQRNQEALCFNQEC